MARNTTFLGKKGKGIKCNLNLDISSSKWHFSLLFMGRVLTKNGEEKKEGGKNNREHNYNPFMYSMHYIGLFKIWLAIVFLIIIVSIFINMPH